MNVVDIDSFCYTSASMNLSQKSPRMISRKQFYILLLCMALLCGCCQDNNKKMFVTKHKNMRDTTTDYPFVSGDVFRSFSRHIVDDTHIPFYPHLVKEKDVVFVKTKYLKKFVKYMHPHIKKPYILITHNGDEEIPGEFEKLLDDNKIIMWFGMNALKHHPKIYPLPIGFGNAGNQSSSEEIIAELQKKPLAKERLLYLNFSVHTHPERQYAKAYFQAQPFCTVDTPKDFKDYIADVMRSKFIVSPRGNGVDCCRVWESLLVGTIPILKSSPLDPLYQDLPVLIVNDWTEVTEEFLEQKYLEITQKAYNLDKLYADYWLKIIDSYANGCYSPTALRGKSRFSLNYPVKDVRIFY
jgi:hypothetical protein